MSARSTHTLFTWVNSLIVLVQYISDTILNSIVSLISMNESTFPSSSQNHPAPSLTVLWGSPIIAVALGTVDMGYVSACAGCRFVLAGIWQEYKYDLALLY